VGPGPFPRPLGGLAGVSHNDWPTCAYIVRKSKTSRVFPLTIQKKNVRIFMDRFRYGVVLTERMDKDEPVRIAACLEPKLSSADLVRQCSRYESCGTHVTLTPLAISN
jgi:hypothetical protein